MINAYSSKLKQKLIEIEMDDIIINTNEIRVDTNISEQIESDVKEKIRNDIFNKLKVKKTVVGEAKSVPKNENLEKFKQIFLEFQELAMTIILLVVPFFSISYVNLFNLICGIILSLCILNVKFYVLFKIKKFALSILVVIDIIDVLFRITMLILFKNKLLDYKIGIGKILNSYFLINADNAALATYHLSISGFIVVCLILYHILKSCKNSNDNFTDEYIFNFRSLRILHNIQYFILFFSYLLICFSGSMHPNILALIYISFVFLILFLWIADYDKLRKKLHRFFAYFNCYVLSIHIIALYLFNAKDLYDIFYRDDQKLFISNLIGITFIYEPVVDNVTQFKLRFMKFLSIILLEFVLLLSSIYLKCQDYISKVKIREKENKFVEKKKIVKDKKSKEINSDGLQIIEPTNKFFTKLRMLIKNYVYSPYFTMHFCRIGVIIWFSYFKSYSSIVLILWLFKSFTISISRDIFFMSAYMVFPILFISTYIAYIVNIDGVCIIQYTEINSNLIRELGFMKYKEDEYLFAALITRIFVTYLFGIFLNIHRDSEKNANLAETNSNKELSNQNVNETKINQENNLREPLMDTNLDSKNLSKQNEYLLNFSDIVIKLIFRNLYVLTMVFIYLVTFECANIFHLIILIIFVMQITNPQAFKKYIKIIIIIIEIIVFTEYIWIFICNKITISEYAEQMLDLFFLDTEKKLTDVEYKDQLLWGALYCLYIEYQKHDTFHEIDKKSINLYEYVNNKFKSKKNFIKVIHGVFDFLREVKIWCLFFGYYATVVFLETNVLNCIKLIVFFFAIHKYLKAIEINFSTAKNSLRYIKVLIITSITLTVFEYFYQFGELKIIQIWFETYFSTLLPEINLNMRYLGFKKFGKNMKLMFIPQIAADVISVLIYREVYYIIIEKKTIITEERESIVQSDNIRRIFFKFLFFILKYYWITVFLTIFWLSIQWKLSISMLLLLGLFIYLLIKCILDYFNKFTINCEKSKLLTNFNSILRTYSEEKVEHFKVSNNYRTRSFQAIWIITIIFIIFTYFISIIIDMKIFYDDKIETRTEMYLKCFSYLAGLYFSNTNHINLTFFEATYGYNLLLIMLIIEKYFQNKCYEFYARLNRLQNKMSFPGKKKIIKLNSTTIDCNEKLELENEISSFPVKDQEIKLKMTDIIQFKTVQDPLSLIKSNVQSDEQFKEKFYNIKEENPNDDKLNKNLSENIRKSYYISQKNLRKSYCAEDLIDGNGTKTEFQFLNVFQRDRSQSNPNFRNSGKSFVDVKELNNIISIDNEDVIIIDSESSSDSQEDTKREFNFESNEKNESKNEIIFKSRRKMTINEISENDEEEDIPHFTRTRRRKNASYKKKSLIKYSLEFQTGIKKLIEEVILFLILLSAIIKINIISFVYIILVIIAYKRGNKIGSIVYLACINLFLFIVQYSLFISNLSDLTEPSIEMLLLKDISENLYLPWYKYSVGFKWGYFFSLGVTKYQINTLWMDFIIIIIIYFYLEYFSFAIFETTASSNKIAFNENERAYKTLSNIAPADYNRFKSSMKLNFDIEIQKIESYELSNQIEKNKNLKNTMLSSTNTEYLGKTGKIKNKLLSIYKSFKSSVYLTFHYYTLILILICSMMNHGLISIPYILFSVIYIYKTHNFLDGNKWTFQHAIRYILKPLLFLDLIGEMLYQVPFEWIIIYNREILKAMRIIGFQKLIQYNNPMSMLNMNSFTLTILKIVTYFLVSIQEIIYNSSDFKIFILKYYLKMKEDSDLNSRLHSYIFNNSRIILMNNRFEERRNIDETLKKIELQLNKWNEKFVNAVPNYKSINSTSKPRRVSSNISVYKKPKLKNSLTLNEKQSFKRIDDISIKRILMKNWLIQISIYIHEQSSSLIGSNLENQKNIERILKGHLNVRCLLEELIDKFEFENENKYNIVEKMRKRKSGLIEIGSTRNSLGGRNSLLSENLSKIAEEANEGYEQHNAIFNSENFKNIDLSDYPNSITPQVHSNFPIAFKKKSSITSTTSLDSSSELIKEMKNEQKEDFLLSTEYHELAELIINEFFNSYCSRCKILSFILLDLIRYFGQNFEYICFVFMIVNHIVYGCFISLVWPILVFCVGLLQYPRPRKAFWKISIIYCVFVICFKFFLQISLWYFLFGVNEQENEQFLFRDIYRIGIQFHFTTFSIKFLYYIVFDLILLSILIANQFILIRKGLWQQIESDVESIEQAHDRINKNNSQLNEEEKHCEYSKESMLLQVIKLSWKQRLIRLFSEMFPKLRNIKPGKNFYAYYTIFQMFLVVYIIFFFTKMDKDNSVFNGDVLKVKQFSVKMIIFSFFHVFLIVFERYLYLQNSRKIKRTNYKIYDTSTGEELSISRDNKLNNIIEDIEDLKFYEENEQFEVVYMQYDSDQNELVYKFIVQILLVFLIHFIVFWYLPIVGNITLHNSSICEKENLQKNLCNEFADNVFIQIFYFLYIVYFILSGLQIKYGMIDLKKQSALMRGDNLLYLYVFKSFKAIPFLYELKSLIDWTFTKTSLDLFKWLKFENIYDILFITKCNMKTYYGRRIGTEITAWDKFFSGGLLSFLLLTIVFGPLVLFSSLNPSNKQNKVTRARIELQIAFVKENLSKNYTLLKNSHLVSIDSITNDEWLENNYDQTIETKNYNIEQVQKVKMSSISETNWGVSDQTFRYIVNTLNNPSGYEINLNLKASFGREMSETVYEKYMLTSSYLIYPLNNTKSEFTHLSDFKNALSICDKETNSTSFTIDNFYNPGIRLSSSTMPSTMSSYGSMKNITLIFTCNSKDSSYWQIRKKKPNWDGIEFFAFSDLISPTSASYDVLTFYVTFILIIGNFVRNFISGEAERVIYTEMPRPHKLLNLCEGIKIYRYKNDLEREDKLYYVLIDLLRSPDMLKMISKSSLQFTNNYLDEEDQKKKKRIVSVKKQIIAKRRPRTNQV